MLYLSRKQNPFTRLQRSRLIHHFAHKSSQQKEDKVCLAARRASLYTRELITSRLPTAQNILLTWWLIDDASEFHKNAKN